MDINSSFVKLEGKFAAVYLIMLQVVRKTMARKHTAYYKIGSRIQAKTCTQNWSQIYFEGWATPFRSSVAEQPPPLRMRMGIFHKSKTLRDQEIGPLWNPIISPIVDIECVSDYCLYS